MVQVCLGTDGASYLTRPFGNVKSESRGGDASVDSAHAEVETCSELSFDSPLKAGRSTASPATGFEEECPREEFGRPVFGRSKRAAAGPGGRDADFENPAFPRRVVPSSEFREESENGDNERPYF